MVGMTCSNAPEPCSLTTKLTDRLAANTENSMPKQTSKSRTNANLNRPKPIPPGEQEISDMRDDAAQAAGTRTDPDRKKYAEGVRDALAWVIGELEDALEV